MSGPKRTQKCQIGPKTRSRLADGAGGEPGGIAPLNKMEAIIARLASNSAQCEKLGVRGALSRKPGREPAAYRIGCRHGSALLPPPSLPARDHPTRHLAVSMNGPRKARARFSVDSQSVAAIYPACDAASAAGLDEVRGSAPNYLGGHCGLIQPAGLADPGPTGCHHTFVRPAPPRLKFGVSFMPLRSSLLR